ncbi:hypothetical protein ACFYNL_25900 [Streptomyces sp. NPDC007808]|uniref:hypothetical protein n=1 Tax=Streptomyces sp. NPDC007808 TaxID=3364779 RepID=UPI0036C9E2D8
MSGRTRAWLIGGWLVLVVGGWSFTESIDDGIEPTSGPRPKSSSPKSPSGCEVPTPAPSEPAENDLADRHGEEPGVATAVICRIG